LEVPVIRCFGKPTPFVGGELALGVDGFFSEPKSCFTKKAAGIRHAFHL
jgi:hypothetical protein